MSRKMRLVIVALMVGSCVLTGCGSEEVVVEAELTPAQIKQQAMEDAAYFDAFVVVFGMDTNGGRYAICDGTTKIVSLDEGETRRVELTAHESVNASLCLWGEESGRWQTVQSIAGVSPGDYLEWDTERMYWNNYTP